MRVAVVVQHALRGEVTPHLVPDDFPQIVLRDVRPDAQRHWEIDQVQPVREYQHAIDGDLDADDVVDEARAAGSERTGHINRRSCR
ncbi:hypothetical protein MKAN_14480 [Mycobacterium kansasii ATCC 12478]|uniref:Uncharacterized protein n=1 Tax=Mycobacterium kansasii ATCC 12478 TaxID=557599 RepID=U5WZ74_MYCKA|nr:hypothetical protein MKAN_14480 [Mycobacterium kansasii ATCC 12478]